MDYLIDTNIVNRISEGRIKLSDLPEGRKFITSIQVDEIMNDSCLLKQEINKQTISVLVLDDVAPSVLVAGLTGAGSSCGSGSVVYEFVLKEFGHQKSGFKKNKRKFIGDYRDALIADTAYSNGMTLLTSDEPLFKIIKKFPGDFLVEFVR